MLGLMTLMNPLGTMAGFVLPLIFVNADDTKGNMQNQFFYHMFSQAVAALLLLIITLMFFKGDKEQRDARIASNTQGSVQFGTLIPAES